MSLKELTKDSHTAAENTKFMKAVFNNTMPLKVWADFTYQKSLIYNAIEGCSGACRLLNDLPDVRRTFLLYQDYRKMSEGQEPSKYRKSTIDYYYYILDLYPDASRLMAHLYTWHLGDLHGGQMIKKVLPGSHMNLEFRDRVGLIEKIRAKLDDSMADEANRAFDWAIKIMNEYDSEFDI